MVIMAESCSDTPLSQESVSSIFTPPTPGLILDSSDEDESVISSRPTTPPPFLVHRMHFNPTKHNELSFFRNVDVCRSLPSPPRPQEGQVSSDETGIMGGEPVAFVPEPQSPVKRLLDRPRRCANTPNKTPPGDSMPLDRFIPVREFTTPPSTTFHVGQSTEELSPEEKMLRRRLNREDPFMVTWQGRAASSPRMASDQLRSPHNTPRLVTDAAITTQHSHQATGSLRHVSAGAVWRVGGVAAALGRRPNGASGGSGSVLARGTTARMYTAKFLPQATPANEQREYEKKKHEARLALALDIDRSKRLLKNSKCWPLLEFTPCPAKPDFERFSPLVWENSAWRRAGQDCWTAPSKEDDKATVVPTLPFRVLDAPGLRDDFYCSTLAYSSVSGILAVALASEVYLWSDEFGVQHPPFSDQLPSNYVSSLSFSSENGRKSILAVGRRSGLLSLWSTFDSEARFEVSHPNSITCVAFKQSKTRRLSERFKNAEVDTEDLAVGDDLGYIWYYSVEWPDDEQAQLGWEGSMTLLAKISAHSQQVCGISWSPDGTYLATGGNDNACLIFELQNIIPPGEFRVPADFTAQTESDNNSTYSPTDNDQDSDRDYLAASVLQSSGQVTMDAMSKSLIAYAGTVISGRTRTAMIPTNYQKHRLDHGAAVKAIAFAPWQPSLLATGGGSNDRAIHFYHTPSGARLATIKVYAQVTGLIWSRTRREIVATFGFSNPEHPFRIAVFAWPSCEQISAIPWGPYGTSWRGPLETDRTIDCGRALCAISYPCRVPIYLYHRLEIQDDSSVRGPRAESNQRRQSAPLERTSTQPRAKEGGLWCSRTMDEGCIIVASSDHTVKFHEVWSNSRRNVASDSGPYGGSEILEGLEGLEKTGEEIIR